MPSLRFAVVYPSFMQFGGAELSVLNGIRALSQAGHHVTLFTAGYDAQHYPPLTDPGTQLVLLGGRGFMEGLGGTVRQIRALSGLLRGYDLVIASSFPAHLWAALGSHGVPVVWWCMEPKRNLYPEVLYADAPGFGAHDYRTARAYSGPGGILRLLRDDPHVLLPYGLRAAAQRLLDRRAVARARAIWTISPYMAAAVRRIYPGRTADVVWVGVSMPPPAAPPKAIVLVPTRLEPIKNVAVVLHAVALLGERLRTARVVIVGHGSESEALRALAARLGIEQRVHFTGHIPAAERDQWYSRALCVVYPALAEPLGLACVEAGLSARAVIADRRGGPADVVVHDETGLLVDMTQPGQLAAALLGLLDDPGRARAMGERAYQRTGDRFALSEWGERFAARAVAAAQDSPS